MSDFGSTEAGEDQATSINSPESITLNVPWCSLPHSQTLRERATSRNTSKICEYERYMDTKEIFSIFQYKKVTDQEKRLHDMNFVILTDKPRGLLPLCTVYTWQFAGPFPALFRPSPPSLILLITTAAELTYDPRKRIYERW